MRLPFHERSATALQNKILGDLPVETQTKILSLGVLYFFKFVYNPEMTFTNLLMLLHITAKLTALKMRKIRVAQHRSPDVSKLAAELTTDPTPASKVRLNVYITTEINCTIRQERC